MAGRQGDGLSAVTGWYLDPGPGAVWRVTDAEWGLHAGWVKRTGRDRGLGWSAFTPSWRPVRGGGNLARPAAAGHAHAAWQRKHPTPWLVARDGSVTEREGGVHIGRVRHINDHRWVAQPPGGGHVPADTRIGAGRALYESWHRSRPGWRLVADPSGGWTVIDRATSGHVARVTQGEAGYSVAAYRLGVTTGPVGCYRTLDHAAAAAHTRWRTA